VHAVTDLEHLGDTLVAKRERRGKRRGARDDHRIEIAGRHRERADDRLVVTGQAGSSNVAPLQIARPAIDQGAHPAPRYRSASPRTLRLTTSEHRRRGELVARDMPSR